MKLITPLFVSLLVAALIIGGCGKDEPAAPTNGSGTPEAKDTAAKAPDITSSLSMNIDLNKSVESLKAEAAKMSVDKLEAVAKKYKDAIVEKDADLQKLIDQLAALPMAEKMGSEAKELSGEIKTLTNTVGALQQRFQVYFDALKAKGGDLSGVSM